MSRARYLLLPMMLAVNAGKSLLCDMRRSRNSTVLCTVASHVTPFPIS